MTRRNPTPIGAKFGFAFGALLVFGVLVASSAYASSYSALPSSWYTGTTPATRLPEGTTKQLTSSSSGGFTFNTSIGSPAVPIKWEAAGVECVGCKIENVQGNAYINEKLRFTNVHLVEPSPGTCQVPATIETKSLKGAIGAESGNPKAATVRITPSEGETLFAFTMGGTNCGFGNTFKITGVAYAKFADERGVGAINQPLAFSNAIQSDLAAGGYTLKWGANPAWFSGTTNNVLQPELSFQVREK